MPDMAGEIRRAGIALAGCTAALLAGCAGGTAEPPVAGPLASPVPMSRTGSIPADAMRPAGTPQINDRWTSCAAAFPATSSVPSSYRIPRYDPSFTAVSVIMCVDAGGGTVRERRTGDVGPVLAALQLPDIPPLDPDRCTADGEIPMELVLLDARGRWVRPGVPADVVCAKRRPEVQQALHRSGLA
ncbi:hypothetical protein ACWT_0109 [Actinoplanes sp. SE50]|uniref:hypothetical protein n=1 Tax=unclassified Actinoplanes TaxID=2626549 RepID=UPI00023ED342|nr:MULTISPECIES: hypothetical protein [unclassified Actinoplanes]AEV81123.1 hypothetical protein ACPL_224 [Actinoplanes sp. SE50/110]ATO79524.1 hypothetical protein ACWT_0109 [Actinoplanes sp. SE50]SLL96925.1 hypothetical protein ACSP50_0114 [Actinoplanes sp. SE50/110]